MFIFRVPAYIRLSIIILLFELVFTDGAYNNIIFSFELEIDNWKYIQNAFINNIKVKLFSTIIILLRYLPA